MFFGFTFLFRGGSLLFCFSGEDAAAGGPGLKEMLESDRCSKILDEEFITNESKSEVEKFGIPHAVHCQDILDDANALYMYVDMWRHST